MAILVVGGAGYVGSHTARRLYEHGYEVLIYDNLSTGNRKLADGFELIVAEIADKEKLACSMRRVDAVMHFAASAYVEESITHPRKYFQNNVGSSLTLLDTALDCGIRNFVFSSSCTVYGVPTGFPIPEHTPRQPINPYGISKLFVEDALESYERAYGLRYAALRYFNAAGADESGEIGELHDPETHVIPLALAAAAGTGPELPIYGTDYATADGTCIRDFVHVNDLAEAHVLALQLLMKGRPRAVLNLGTGVGHSIRQLLTAIEDVTGRRVPCRTAARRPGDPPILVADPSRAQSLLSWTARRSLRQIVSTAWLWHARQPNLDCASP
jgi:UDP-glucose-4-epimerase GalE